MSEYSTEELLAKLAAMEREKEALQKQLAATQSGSGGIAQENSVAAGAGGIAVGGNVEGGIYIGSAPTDPEEALRIYREVYVSTCRQLPLRGVDVGASDPTSGNKPVDLDQVYVSLDTTRTEQTEEERQWFTDEKPRPVSALKATAQSSRLVILGDPGSGKSTFLNHLGLCLALHGLEPKNRWLERLPDWPVTEPAQVPVLVVLRDFAAAVINPKGVAPKSLWSFILDRLDAQNLSFAEAPLHEALENGRALVLLDGLDEVPTAEQRSFVRDAVAAFANRYRNCRMIVTCRTLSYQDPAWQLTGVPSVELAQFSAEKIDQFITAWYQELSRTGIVKSEQANTLAARLQEAIRRSDLWRLAPNPLLLTVMALVHTHKGRLPDARAVLYEETVEILLWRWEQIKLTSAHETPRLRQLLSEANRTDVDLKRILWELAYESHAALKTDNADSLADIGELRLQKALAALHPQRSLDWAADVIESMKARAGLLLERIPERYTFPHRTFQEYLAGAHLARQSNFARETLKLTESIDLWRQVILLAVGRLVYLTGETEKPLLLVGELCTSAQPVDAIGWRRVWLAGEILAEMGLNRVQDSAVGMELLERVRKQLVNLFHVDLLSPVERAKAGDVLAQIGDPRFRPDFHHLLDDPMFGFIEIPAGPFTMGENREAHEVTLRTFYIARFPVTVAQFRAYVDAIKTQPEAEESVRDPANRPVRYVSWHEALRYCEWLTETLRSSDKTPPDLRKLLASGGKITLPSEAEWEKAARGTDGRRYPWGDDIDANFVNYGDTKIGDTSTVGCFPGGTSPYGIEEMSGNVWEWTRSFHEKYPYPTDERERQERESLKGGGVRVLRGGAFYYNENDVRCAFRSGSLTGSRGYHLGFRVVVVVPPFTSALCCL